MNKTIHLPIHLQAVVIDDNSKTQIMTQHVALTAPSLPPLASIPNSTYPSFRIIKTQTCIRVYKPQQNTLPIGRNASKFHQVPSPRSWPGMNAPGNRNLDETNIKPLRNARSTRSNGFSAFEQLSPIPNLKNKGGFGVRILVRCMEILAK